MLEQIERRLEAELVSNGWQIETRRSDSVLEVRVRHRLTTELGLTFQTGEGHDPLGFMRRFMARSEIETIRNAPRDMRNAELIGDLRRIAHAGQWESRVLTAVARLLQAHSFLDEPGSIWLEHAGVPWADKPAEIRGTSQ